MLKRVIAPSSRTSKIEKRRVASPLIEYLESRTLLSTTWYVATNGSDANPGTLAAPFHTIQHGADVAGPGNTVFIRGGVYHEQVTVHKSGTASARIVFRNYQNESVTIDGADPITGWVNAGGKIWTASMPTDLGQGNNQVFVDHVLMNDARWPNNGLDLSHPVLESAPSVTATTTSATINDPKLTQPAGFWVGATIRIGAGQNWGNQTGTVTASGVGFVTFSYLLHSAKFTVPTAGNHYYLFGVAGALDSAGEFFRSASGKVSLWTPAGDNPGAHIVEAKARLYAFDLSAAAYIRIQGIHLFAATITTSTASIGVVMDHITAEYVSHFSIDPLGNLVPFHTGIILAGANDVLENSVLVYSAGDGVEISGTGAVVNNNLIHDCDYAGVDAAPIRIGGYSETISKNTCYNTGRDGLLFSGYHDYILNNNVFNYGLQTTDLGGFYSAGHNGLNTVIAYNKFHDGITGGFGGAGIMFDNSSSGYIVHHNITWNVNAALKINYDTHNIQIYNNTFDATTYGILTDGLADDWTGTILENNIITHPIQFGNNVQLIDNISNHQQFVGAAHGDFTLLPGAPAVDTGMLLPPYTNGFVGKAPDVGALELGLKAFATGAILSSIPPDPSV